MNQLPKEIERKFLLKDPAKISEIISECPIREMICQGFLSVDIDKVIRIRRTFSYLQNAKEHATSTGFLTVKGRSSGAEGITRTEIETEIDSLTAQLLLDTFCANRIYKNRFKYFDKHGLIWEIDCFYGDNEGLWVVEVELQSETQEFEKPYWVGEEVSNDPKYTNVALSTKPFNTW